MFVRRARGILHGDERGYWQKLAQGGLERESFHREVTVVIDDAQALAADFTNQP